MPVTPLSSAFSPSECELRTALNCAVFAAAVTALLTALARAAALLVRAALLRDAALLMAAVTK